VRIAWSDVAEADLDDLYDYIARDVQLLRLLSKRMKQILTSITGNNFRAWLLIA
jgi:plasmid stabilization system protein ParE